MEPRRKKNISGRECTQMNANHLRALAFVGGLSEEAGRGPALLGLDAA